MQQGACSIGSIRVPAALTGTVGLKATFGRIRLVVTQLTALPV
jgi:hypothetical protein